MGGVAGHMMHLYENPELTFRDIKEIFLKAASGKLSGTEKTDGQNLFVSYSVKDKVAKAARNKGNIKAGGLNASELAEKFADRGDLTSAFTESFDAFEKAMKRLDEQTLVGIFGTDANVFYNAEIMDPRSSNVIKYDTKSLVFHQVGHAEFNKETGDVTDSDVANNVRLLNAAVQRIEKEQSIKDGSYKIRVNAVRNLKALADQKPYDTAVAQLSREMGKYGLEENETIADYLVARLIPEINSLVHNASKEAKSALLRRLLNDKDMNSNMVFMLFPKEQKQQIRDIIREQANYLKKAIWPIEEIVHDFSVEALKGLQSAFILDNEKEVQRLQQEVATAVAAIENSKNDDAMQMLQLQLKKLKDVKNVYTAAEGFVFVYDGQAYKFTGNFAPVNQILGLFKYGRGSVPAMIKEDDERAGYHLQGSRKLALVPGAFKPPHKGHLELVRAYANNTDKVIVFMSPLARKMPDGKDMTYALAKSIWITYLKAEKLDQKVEILESPVNSPVGAVYQFISNENDKEEWAQPGDEIVLGVSLKGGDQERFSVEKIAKYAREGVRVVGGEEAAVAPTAVNGMDLSASDMREAITKNNARVFARFIPDSLKQHAKQILFNIRERLDEQAGEAIKEDITRLIDRMILEALSGKIDNSLNIPRSALPQIKDMDDFRKFLNKKHRALTYKETKLRPIDLKPIQEEYDPKKVEKFKQWQIDNPTEPGKPVVVSNDLYIIDGHHRWLACKETHPRVPIAVLIIKLPFAEVLKLAKTYTGMLTEGWIEKTYGQVGVQPFHIKLDDTHLDVTTHGAEREVSRDGARIRIPEDQIKLAVNKAIPQIMHDLANGEVGQHQVVHIRAIRRGKLDLNIVAGMHMQKGKDSLDIITVMEKNNFVPLRGTNTETYTVELK